jgi:hypothetical protein
LKNLQKTSKRAVFESETRAEMELLRQRLESLDDLLNEGETLITIVLMGIGEEQSRNVPTYSEVKTSDIKSKSITLITEYQRWIKAIENNLVEYKRVYKLDFNSEDFQKKAQILVSTLKESEEFLSEARATTMVRILIFLNII